MGTSPDTPADRLIRKSFLEKVLVAQESCD